MPILYATPEEGMPYAVKGVSIIKSGEIATRKAEFAKCLYVVEGVALAYAFGDPDRGFAAIVDEDETVYGEFFESLETAAMQVGGRCAASYHSCYGAANEGGLKKLNWVKVLAFLKEWGPIILMFLEDKPE